MFLLRSYIFFVFLIFFFTSSVALESNWSNNNESKVRIISSLSNLGNSEKFYLGLEYKLNDEWKTYWKSPGDGGFPQEISWENSKNIESLELFWPKPQRFEILDLNSLGYFEHVIFPLSIKPKDLSKPVEIFLDINYLTCKEICIPNYVKLDLTIPSGLSSLTEHSHNIEKFLSKVPEKNKTISFVENIEVNGLVDNKNISFILEADSKDLLVNTDVFIHSEKGLPVVIPSIAISSDSKNLKANFIFDKKLIKEENIDI